MTTRRAGWLAFFHGLTGEELQLGRIGEAHANGYRQRSMARLLRYPMWFYRPLILCIKLLLEGLEL
jgi:hypothetical protein